MRVAASTVGDQIVHCIYCDGPGPFNEEHVFPAGLGGDDRAYLLLNCVCVTCNSEFSKLETKFMRSSPEAISRVFFSATGRARGGVASPPRLEVPSISYIDPEVGIAKEIELSAGGVARLAPQIVFADLELGQLRITGSDKQELVAFLEILRETLGEDAVLVHKKSRDVFSVTTFHWQSSEYVEQLTETCAKPPARCVWIERFLAPLENESVESRRSLLFQRSRGQLALRLLAADAAAQCLSMARKATMGSPKAVRDAVGTYIDQPSITLRMSIDEDAWIRVQFKIGANLACRVFGATIDTPDMHALRKYIRFGGETRPLELQEDPNFLAIFDAIKGEHHLMVLAAVPVPDSDRCALVFGLRLFRAAFTQMMLAVDLPRSLCGDPRVFCVRYRENRIEQFGLLDLAQMAIAQRRSP